MLKVTLRGLLLTGCALASAAPVLAQNAEPTEVVIVGRRPLAESEAAALKVQKNSDSLVSVLSADAIGDLPDQNIAQALSRLPGISVERDQGQARYVNLRGAPRYWTTLSFDGISVVSPEGRQTRFDNIPSAIASQVTVQKALVPSMMGDTVAGNVDIRTRRAFDYMGQKITGKIGVGYVELGEGQEIDSSLVYSNIFFGGKLGIVAQASYYTRDMATENWETDPYRVATAALPLARFATDTKNKHYRLTRENTSYSLRADYKLSNNHTLFFSTIASKYFDDENRDQFIFQFPNGTDAAGNAYTSTTFTAANNPVKGTVYGARVSGRITYREYTDTMLTNTFGGEHVFDNGLQASWRANYTWAENSGDQQEARFATNNSGSAFTARPTVDYDFTDRTSNIATLYATGGTDKARTKGASTPNVESYLQAVGSSGQITQENADEITEAYTLKADFDYKMKIFGRDSKVEFGGLWVTREKTNEVLTKSAPVTGLTTTYSSLAQDGPYLGKQRLGYTFRYTNVDKTKAFFATNLNPVKASLDQTSYYNVRETVEALYLMSTTEFDWGNIVYGVRGEQITNKGTAFSDLGKTTIENDIFLAYPSVHLNWDITDQFKARFGATTSASRADFDDYAPNLDIDDGLSTINGGNPFIKPEKQVGLDATLEYYGNDHFFSVGVFHKSLTDTLFRQRTTFGSTALNTSTIDRSNYAFLTNTNGGDGDLTGLELYYSGSFKEVMKKLSAPSWTEGFGLRANLTVTDSNVSIPQSDTTVARVARLSGASDVTTNMQLIYEKYGLSVRLAAQYRTPTLQNLGGYTTLNGTTTVIPNGNGDIYWDDDMEVDFSARYQINKRVEVFFDALNLTNDGQARYADSAAFPIEYERFGKRFIAGARFNF